LPPRRASQPLRAEFFKLEQRIKKPEGDVFRLFGRVDGAVQMFGAYTARAAKRGGER
jgi:hypothetical protein